MRKQNLPLVLFLISSMLFVGASAPTPQELNPQPPDEVVRLVFIHHSCGENWLTDGYGDLGRELAANNYFVSDTNYGWGPDSIGDRTDIPDWMEWFRSGQTGTITQALYGESGQHSPYTRPLADPGGENTIVMFKSCYPNSELSGSPNDPPGTYADLSVSGAKFVYNELLKYFETRPDKLFIVVTAPPVRNRDHSDNARAFNNWLVEDWLSENKYTLPNVAVFDFYNVLTANGAHHRYHNGEIEHVTTNKNTNHYPSGDDHPSEKGSRKATEEFVPLLNVYYNIWQASAPQPAPESGVMEEQAHDSLSEETPAGRNEPSDLPAAGGTIDDFESDNPPGTNGWEPFHGDSPATSMHCATDGEEAHKGKRSLIVDFDLAPNDWGTCSLLFDGEQDWSASEGITFMLRASQAGLVFDVDLHTGSDDALQTYQYTIETSTESMDGWIPISLRWADFHRVEWEEGAGSAFASPERVSGIAFGVNTYPDTGNTGTIRVDDLALLGNGTLPEENAGNGESGRAGGSRLPCGMIFILPLLLVSGGLWQEQRRLD